MAMALENLKTLGAAAAKSANDPNFRAMLYSEVEKQFDGDNNVLFKQLAENASQANARTQGIMTEMSVTEAQDAFKAIEGTDYYPQVYIPYYEEMSARRAAGRVAIEDVPPIVLFVDDTQDEFPAYALNETGELEETGQLIDEEYALAIEVWVISINETYFGDDNTDGSSESTVVKSARIRGVKAKCNKESWAAGASEVHIITMLSSFNFTEGSLLLYGGRDFQGGQLKKIRRRDIGDWVGLNFKVILQWDNWPDTRDYANFVIFEYDSWPTGKRDVSFAHSAQQSYEIVYRSSHSKYSSHIVTRDEWPQILNPAYANNCIGWKSSFE